MQVNPPKMEKFDDVSNMTYLNEAAVLWNLKARYVAKLIYVSSYVFLRIGDPLQLDQSVCHYVCLLVHMSIIQGIS